MGRINRRIYATRRKRSPYKTIAPPPGSSPTPEDWRKGAGATQSPPYLSEENEEGIGGDKTYTIKEVQK